MRLENGEGESKPDIVSALGFPYAIMGLVVAMVVLTTVVVTALQPKLFKSTAYVRIEHDGEDLAGSVALESEAKTDLKFFQAECEVLLSDAILHKVSEAQNLPEVWGKKFRGGERLKTTEVEMILWGRTVLYPYPEKNLVAIICYSETPDEAANLANGIAESYRDYRAEERRRPIDAQIRKLTESLMAKKNEMETLQMGLKQGGEEANSEAPGQIEVLERASKTIEKEIAGLDYAQAILWKDGKVIVERATVNHKVVRPMWWLNFASGGVMGVVAGLALAGSTYLAKRKAHRRNLSAERSQLPPELRRALQVMIAVAAGLVLGYQCSDPLLLSSIIIALAVIPVAGLATAGVELVGLTTGASAASPSRPDGSGHNTEVLRAH